jgi:hypothetical protein
MVMLATNSQTGAPQRSLRQRLDALDRANDIRSFRASEKKLIKRRERSALDHLLDPPDRMESMKIFDLLLAMPTMGRVKVNRVLNVCRISPSKTVGGLTERQRVELASMLRRR